jgi:antitoxin CptB
MAEAVAIRVKKLRWLCRRGMKELDVLLEDFLARHDQNLTAGCWPELESLLAQEDDLLWDWLQQPAREQAAPYHELLHKIRRGPE